MGVTVMMRWTPQRSDLAQAFEARRHRLGFRRRELLLAWLLLTAGIVSILFGDLPFAVLGLVFGGALAVPVTGRALSAIGIRRLWRTSTLLHRPVELTVSDDGVRFRTDVSDALWAWTAFSRWIDAADVYVLCHGERFRGPFTVVAKRGAPSDVELDGLRSALVDHLGPALRSQAA